MSLNSEFKKSGIGWSRSALTVVISFGFLLLIVHPHIFMGDSAHSSKHIHTSYPLHSTLEAIIGISALLLGFSIWSRKPDAAREHLRPISFGLWSMGVFALIHSAVSEPHEFVLLYSLSMLSGAAGFFLCWIPHQHRKIAGHFLTPWIVIFVATCFSLIAIVSSSFGLTMIQDGSFTLPAKSINFIAGLFFAAAAIKLINEASKSGRSWDLYLVATIAIFGAVAGLTFPFSQAWSHGWWVHHLLRLGAFILTLIVLQVMNTKTDRQKEAAHMEKAALAEELSINEERLSLALKATSDGLWDWDLLTNDVFFSPRWKTMLGYHEHELQNSFETWENLVHPDDLGNAKKNIEDYLSGKNRSFEPEFRMKHKEGHYLNILSRGIIVKNETNQKPMRFVGTHTDLTPIRKIERERESERKQLNSLFDSIDDIIYLADPESYTLIYVNKAFKKIWGDDVLDKKCYKVLQDRDEPCPFCTNDKIFGDNLGKTYIWEFQNEVSKRWFRCVDKAIIWSDGRYVRFEIATDITESKLFAQEQIRLEKLSLLGQVAAGVAHELNNPLMGILNYAQYCLDETDREDERFPILEDIEHETRRCAKIVENLLNASRMDGSTSGKIFTFDPGKVIDRVLRLLEYRTSKEKVLVNARLNNNGQQLKMSQDAFQQLFINLFTNAIDAVESTEKKEVSVNLTSYPEKILLEIEDTGCGIPHDIREKIFDPFFTTKAPGKGTGLGLATCWKIIKSQRGNLECQSRPDYGTKMLVTLPAEHCNKQSKKGTRNE